MGKAICQTGKFWKGICNEMALPPCSRLGQPPDAVGTFEPSGHPLCNTDAAL